LSWNITEEDIKAIELIITNGPMALTELVRELFGIEDNDDRLRKINRFRIHLEHLVNNNFLEIKDLPDENVGRNLKKYCIPGNVVIGPGLITIFTGDGYDVSNFGVTMKFEHDEKVTLLTLKPGKASFVDI
jgi:hypothetical protein